AALWKFHPAGGSPAHGVPAVGKDGTVFSSFGSGAGAEAKSTFYALKPPAGVAPAGVGGAVPDAQVGFVADLGLGQAVGVSGNSATIAADGTIFALGGGGRLAALGADGNTKWTGQAGPATGVSPALGSDGT